MKQQWRLLRYAFPHWRPLAIAGVSMMASIAISLARPWPLKLMVDNVLGDQPLAAPFQRLFDAFPGPNDREGLLVWVCLSMVVIVLVGIVVDMGKSLASVIFGQRVTYDVGGDLFLHLQKLSLLFHGRQPVGDSVARVTGDAACVTHLVSGALLPLIQSTIMITTTFLILWRISPPLTLVSLSAVPFLILVTRLLAPPMKRRNRQRRNLEGDMMSVVQQSLSSMPVIQAFGREEQEGLRFRDFADRTVGAYQRTTLAELWFQIAVGLILSVSTSMLMYVGGLYALDGKVTTGTIVLFLLYLLGFYGPLQSLSSAVASIQLAAAEADRVMEFMNLEPDITDRPGARDVVLRGRVQYDHVDFGYLETMPVLTDVSLDVQPGQTVAIVGPTGAGKTTLVSLLLRFFDPWIGTVKVDGVDIRDVRLHSLRRQVAMVLQEPFILPLTVAENIAYGKPDATETEIVAAATAASANEFIDRLPNGYHTVVGERGATLSGGEKQRLALARAFIMDAPILVLDEPTSAIDARTEGLLLVALKRLMANRTTFVVAHRLSTIQSADHIVVVDRGRIAEAGSHDQLINQNGLYAGLYRQQMNLARHDTAPEHGVDQPIGMTSNG
jgi:ATP-binding cassette subfamily B protein/subfamily B ATP-binding cassette protein MsbA